ncbi:hypothetical protein Pla110_20180 [Polystyrenella longa]|uniref:Uncharacterized protein n=1 Tax=Polystyrenella longa TaxID=2528007 RepID=A0A518CM33_9PLAN|nr:hypothetical protein [Polystyrenella longa]QDU80291.1 hypothetical protein Pla110_20180 [Polystyrenella longa]
MMKLVLITPVLISQRDQTHHNNIQVEYVPSGAASEKAILL